MPDNQNTRRITLIVCPDNASEALSLTEHFLTKYPDNHRSGPRANRHGVKYRIGNKAGGFNNYYVFGDSSHVRVMENFDD